jgi:hypothetical protein
MKDDGRILEAPLWLLDTAEVSFLLFKKLPQVQASEGRYKSSLVDFNVGSSERKHRQTWCGSC